MIANFRDNRAAFENLVQMVREDEQKIGKRFFRIDDDWTEPKNLEEYGICTERVWAYRKIFREIDIPREFGAYGEGTLYTFTSSAQGLAVSGSSKGFAWSKDPPGSLIDGDLDKYHQENVNPNDYVFRPIDGNWYLVREQ